jgi:hypothetical protein
LIDDPILNQTELKCPRQFKAWYKPDVTLVSDFFRPDVTRPDDVRASFEDLTYLVESEDDLRSLLVVHGREITALSEYSEMRRSLSQPTDEILISQNDTLVQALSINSAFELDHISGVIQSSITKTHDLFNFMLTATRDMADEYKRIRSRATEDPGTAGDQAEENWASLLRGWLPAGCKVVTKGRILTHEGIAGPQVDVLVLAPSYPEKMVDTKVYFAGGVLAAFECKLTLKAQDIHRAVENSVRIKQHLPSRIGTPYRELQAPIVYGVLAHAHNWVRAGSNPRQTIEEHLRAADEQLVAHPREMLDAICVADLGTWYAVKTVAMNPRPLKPHRNRYPIVRHKGPIATGYMGTVVGSDFTAIGSMVVVLLRRLAWEDASLQTLADYFSLTGIAGPSSGRTRAWDTTTLSEQVRRTTHPFDQETKPKWNEWSGLYF